MKKLLLLLIIPFLSFGQTPITDDNMYDALGLWCSNAVEAESIYGHVSDWDVSNVTYMHTLFYMGCGPIGAMNFNDDISNWDVSNVTNMNALFRETTFNQDISGWDVSNATNMEKMFYRAEFNQDISGWDVSNVTNMKQMFEGADFNQDISGWDVSNVTNMEKMFAEWSMFNQDIGNWDISNVTNMEDMFGSGIAIENYDALLNCWSTLELQQNVSFGCEQQYCLGQNARASIIYYFNWDIDDGGLFDDGDTNFCNSNDNSENCNNTTFIQEIHNNKSQIKTIDILGRDTNQKGFQLHIYDDGSVEKKYLIK